jgi:YfiH family protein
MYWKKKNGLAYLQFPRLSQVPGVQHAIFLRYKDGRSDLRSSFNLGLGCGDHDDQVWGHRRQASAMLDMDTMVLARQVHGDQVRMWPSKDAPSTSKSDPDHVFLSGDALVSGHSGQALFIQTADCQSVLMADPRRSVVANIHCGWRGSIANIIGRTVDLMAEQYGSRREDLHCAIGPSLGPCCAEFIHYRDEFPENFWPYRLSANRFDFWRISLDQLVAAGVPKAHVEISHFCTRCNPHLFFSYRGEGKTGRFAAVIGLAG